MKKIISLFLIALLMITLAACGGDDDPEVILDCLLNPEAEGCEIPDDVDCLIDPDAEGCEVDPGDTRTAEEILADAITDNWDGDITHLNTLLDAMDYSESMEVTAEFNFEGFDELNAPFLINVVMTDSFVFAETGDVLERHLVINIDGEIIETTMIFEELDTGVAIYVEISDVVDKLEIEEPEVADIMTVLGIDQDWLKFIFDDSLANMVEIEVMRVLLVDIFFKDNELTFFSDLEAQIEADIGVVLGDYTLDLDLLMDALALGNYASFRTQVGAVDFDALLLAIDDAVVVPAIVDLLNRFSAEFTLEGFDVPATITFIEANGTEAYFATLSDANMAIFLNMIPQSDDRLVEQTIDKLRSEIPWQVTTVINLPIEDLETQATISWMSNRPSIISNTGVVVQPIAGDWDGWVELVATVTVGEATREEYFQVYVPPVDAPPEFVDEYNDYYYDEHEDPLGDYLKDTVHLYDVILLVKDLKDTLVALDYTVIELETVDLELLADAIYDGQIAYDAFVATLVATAPQNAALLAAFSPVIEYTEHTLFVADVKYALEHLTMFEDYLTAAYYVNNNYVNLTIDQTPTFEIETTATLAVDAFGDLFMDVVDTASDFIGGFTEVEIPYLEYLNCPLGEVCEEWDDYDRIVSRLNDFSSLEVVTTFDPSNLGEIEMNIDLTTFVNSVVNMTWYDDELLDRAVDKLYCNMPWQVIAVIDLPTTDVETGATIVWTSNDPALITAAGVVTPPPAGEWDRWVELVAEVTVGQETETLYFHVTVPPVDADPGMGDEYDNDCRDEGNGIFDLTSVTDLSLTITVKDSATVTIPTTTEDVNAIAEDFARFSLSIMAHDYAHQIAEHYVEFPLDLLTDIGTNSLSYYEWLPVSKAFDSDLSEVVIVSGLNGPEFSIKLVWIDGTDVFDNPLTLAELALMFGDEQGGPDTNAIFNTYVEAINETNFNMTKLLFVFIFNERYEENNDDQFN